VITKVVAKHRLCI